MEYFKTEIYHQKLIEVYDQSGNENNRLNPTKQTRFKTNILQSDLCD